MTAAQAIAELRDHNAIGDDYREGWHAALSALELRLKPAPKRAAKPAQSRHVTAFLKERFPEGTSLPGGYGRYGADVDLGRRRVYRELMGRDAPELDGPAAAQFSYGLRGGEKRSDKRRDAAILMGAKA